MVQLFLKFYRLFNFYIPVDYEVFSISRFMKWASRHIAKDSLVLDAGAGTRPYKKYFNNVNYQSTDYVNPAELKVKHTFLSDLKKIPKKNNTYDAIINTQTLEHVKDPQAILKEFYRILKPNGKLFLTAPCCWGVHYAPNNYFMFTNYGLELMFKTVGFKVVFIKPRGGFFVFLGRMFFELPFNIYGQYILKKPVSAITYSQVSKFNFISFGTYLLFIPFLISLPFTIIIPLICFLLDFLDKEKNFTLGYSCYCIKDK